MSYSNRATKPTTSHHLGLGPMVGHPPLPSRPSLPPLPPASHPATASLAACGDEGDLLCAVGAVALEGLVAVGAVHEVLQGGHLGGESREGGGQEGRGRREHQGGTSPVSQQGPYHVAGYSRVSWQYGGGSSQHCVTLAQQCFHEGVGLQAVLVRMTQLVTAFGLTPTRFPPILTTP